MFSLLWGIRCFHGRSSGYTFVFMDSTFVFTTPFGKDNFPVDQLSCCLDFKAPTSCCFLFCNFNLFSHGWSINKKYVFGKVDQEVVHCLCFAKGGLLKRLLMSTEFIFVS